jgi:hypothetical protein
VVLVAAADTDEVGPAKVYREPGTVGAEMRVQPQRAVADLIARCERVGWLITQTQAGFTVDTPRGPVAVALAYPYPQSPLPTIRKVERFGLLKAEEQMATVAKKATKAAPVPAFSEEEQNAAIARAAGPYVRPEAVKITWFAQPHPSPWMRWVIMTPEIARYLVDNHNTINRPLNSRRREHYKKIILRGDWHLTHQGMAMDEDGNLQDGQHRLYALIDAAEESDNEGFKLAVPFFVGMARENFLAIDEGGNRTAPDLFARGGESYGGAIATVVRLTLAFEAKSPKRMIRERQTNEMIVNTFGTDPEEFREAAKFGVAHSRKAKVAPGPLGAAYYLLRRANGLENRYVEAFFEGLVVGTKSGSRVVLDDGDPRRVTREFFANAKESRRRLSGLEAVAIIVLAWNNVVENRNPRYVRFTEDTEIPRVTIMKDSGDNAAVFTAPQALLGELEETDE